MNVVALEFALLTGVAVVSGAMSLTAPALRRAAAVTAACLVLWCVRLTGGPRAAVAVFVLWPGAIALMSSGAPRGTGLLAYGAGVTAYAFVLAYWGAYLAPWWSWLLFAPNVAPALALWFGKRPQTWAERATCVLPASALADAVTIWAGAPSTVRAFIGCVTWFTFGCMLLLCASRRPARG